MASKVNKTALSEAEEHKDRLDSLSKSMETMAPSDERDEFIATLKYVSNIVNNHYRNLLHCFSYEKNTKK